MDHPGVARLLELRHDEGGRPCLLMEAVEGRSLADLLAAEGPLSGARLLALGEALLDALEHLAARGLVHRDLKPANVVLRADGAPVLVDFSVVRSLAPRDDPTLTGAGQALGTSAYMAPEQCGGDRGEITPQTDLYGLGALLFHAASGVPPWEHESGWERTQRNPWRQPYPSRSTPRAQVEAARARLPVALGEAIAWALEGEAARRVPDAPSLRAALRGELASDSQGMTSENHDPKGGLDPSGRQRRKESPLTFLRASLAVLIALGLAGGLAHFALTADPAPPPAPRPQLPGPGGSPSPGSSSPGPSSPGSSQPSRAEPGSSAPLPGGPQPELAPFAAAPEASSSGEPLAEAPAPGESAPEAAAAEPHLQRFDRALRAQSGAEAIVALIRLRELGAAHYPAVARGVAQLSRAGDWAKTAVLFNGQQLFDARLTQWGLQSPDVGVSEAAGESAFRGACVVFLRGEPEAVVRSLSAHRARFPETPQPLMFVQKLEDLSSPSASALLGEIALEGHESFVRDRALEALGRRDDPVARAALERVRDAGGEGAALAGAYRLKQDLKRPGVLILDLSSASDEVRAALRVGDLILSCNGVPLVEEDASSDALAETREARLRLLRGGVELDVSVSPGALDRVETTFHAP